MEVRGVLVSRDVRNITDVHPASWKIRPIDTLFLIMSLELWLYHAQRHPTAEHIILLLCYLLL